MSELNLNTDIQADKIKKWKNIKLAVKLILLFVIGFPLNMYVLYYDGGLAALVTFVIAVIAALLILQYESEG